MPSRSITTASQVPAHRADRQFLASNPGRKFRARGYVDGDVAYVTGVPVFANDEIRGTGEVNLAIVARIPSGRIRLLFAAWPMPKLCTDKAIDQFLRSRNIDPRDPLAWINL